MEEKLPDGQKDGGTEVAIKSAPDETSGADGAGECDSGGDGGNPDPRGIDAFMRANDEACTLAPPWITAKLALPSKGMRAETREFWAKIWPALAESGWRWAPLECKLVNVRRPGDWYIFSPGTTVRGSRHRVDYFDSILQVTSAIGSRDALASFRPVLRQAIAGADAARRATAEERFVKEQAADAARGLAWAPRRQARAGGCRPTGD